MASTSDSDSTDVHELRLELGVLARNALAQRPQTDADVARKMVWISWILGDVIEYIELQLEGVYAKARQATEERKRLVLRRMR